MPDEPATPNPPETRPAETPSTAIGKALTLIRALVDAGRPLTLQELADGAGLAKASAHRQLLQLEETGLVKRDLTTKRYLVGDVMGRLALDTLGAVARTGAVRDIVLGLVDRLGETVNLGVLDGREVLYLERVECREPLRLHLRAGSRVPLHATATGKLILAFASADKRRRLLDGHPFAKLTKNTLDREALLAQLQEIRDEGMSLNREESVLGITGLAVPVLDAEGGLLGGLAVHAPLSRMDEAAARRSAPVLKAAAREISRSLAHRDR